MAEPTSLNLSRPDNPITASGEKFAKQAATTIEVEAKLPEGGAPAEGTVSVTTTGSAGWFDWAFGGWFKRKAQHNGSSAGVKGKIEF